MGQVYASIKPFADDTGTAYADDFIDVTQYLTRKGVSPIKYTLDNNEFDIGIFRHSNFDIEFDNRDGSFSAVGKAGSIFNFNRDRSIVRIEWEYNHEARPLGLHPPGNFTCSPRQVIGDFFLSDIPAQGRALNQTVKFKCLGYTTLFDRALVPYSSINNGDQISEVIYKCLNQSPITDFGLLTLDSANISIANDSTIDDKTLGDLENETVKDALKKLLLFSNSVLFLVDNTIYVKSRTASTDLKFTFTGPGSLTQLENIIDIQKINDGKNRIINFVSVEDKSFSAVDATSRDDNGLRAKKIQFRPISDQTKNETACQAIVDEFKSPKEEFDVITRMNYDRLDLNLLDKVAFDYPLRTIPGDGLTLPIFDIAVFGDSFGVEIKDVEISSDSEFKILAKTVDLIKETMTFSVKEI